MNYGNATFDTNTSWVYLDQQQHHSSVGSLTDNWLSKAWFLTIESFGQACHGSELAADRNAKPADRLS